MKLSTEVVKYSTEGAKYSTAGVKYSTAGVKYSTVITGDIAGYSPAITIYSPVWKWGQSTT
ncbi:MAG: hypothetical protein GY757_40675 [bacterium]|nr:hypothetical protein [bacterium]